jgi:hypothetical protein
VARDRLGQLVSQLSKVYGKTKEIDSLLGQMATLTQSENTIGTTIVQEQSKLQRQFQKKADVQHRREDNLVFPKEAPEAIEKLYNGATLFSEESPFHESNLMELWKSLDEKIKKILQAIHETYKTFIDRSHFLDRPGATKTGAAKAATSEGSAEIRSRKRFKTSSGDNKKAVATQEGTALGTDTTTSSSSEVDYKEKITESTKMLTELFQLAFQSEENKSVAADTPKTHFFPGPKGQEVPGAQPFLTCLLDAICHLAETLHAQQCSTSKLKTEAVVDSLEPNGSEEAARSPPKSSLGKSMLSKDKTVAFALAILSSKRVGAISGCTGLIPCQSSWRSKPSIEIIKLGTLSSSMLCDKFSIIHRDMCGWV